MSSITTAETIQRLRRTFAQEGVPRVLVSDNGPSLVSAEMERWLSAIGCRHIRAPPYHPRSNGLAERFVRTLKEHLLAAGETADMQTAVDKFLLGYRNAPHSTTGEAPAVLLKGHLLRTRVTALSAVGDKLWVKQHSQQQPKWKPATVVATEGSRVIKVELPEGGTQRCHMEQTKPRFCEDEQPQESVAEPVNNAESDVTAQQPVVEQPQMEELSAARPRRNARPPDRFGVVTY